MATTTLPQPPTRTAPRRYRTVLLLVLVAALAVVGAIMGAVSGASGDEPQHAPPRLVDSVGHVDGSTALVAVLAHGDEVTAYVCDGDTTTGERFSGTLLGDRAVLHSAGGAQLAVDVTEGAATGIFTPAGATAGQAFTTTPSTGSAGWYTAEAVAADGPVAANWVVLADGTQTGVENIHKHKHRGHKVHIKPGKPSGVSPKADGTTAEPDEGLVSVLVDGRDCAGSTDRLCGVRKTVAPQEPDESPVLADDCRIASRTCPARGTVDPVELDGGLVLLPVRREVGEARAPSGDPQSLAGS